MSDDKKKKEAPEKQEYTVVKNGKVINMFPKDAERLIEKGVITGGKVSRGKKVAEV